MPVLYTFSYALYEATFSFFTVHGTHYVMLIQHGVLYILYTA